MVLILNSIYPTVNLTKTTKEITVRTVTESDSIKIEISDNGVGIDEEIIEKIWEPGFTTKPNHLGLGLSTSKNIVDKLKGKIKVESTPNVITRFIITIPTKLT